MTKKTETETESAARAAEFQRRLQDDPVGAINDIGVELLAEEAQKMSDSLRTLIDRSLQTAGSATAEHKVTRQLGSKGVTVSMVVTVSEVEEK